MSEIQLEAGNLAELMTSIQTHLTTDAIKALTAENVRIAVNQSLLDSGINPVFADGDEIAFLPPVTGG